MTQTPITLASVPGIVTRGTLAQRIGRWIDGELVRFDGRSVVPMAGWQVVSGDRTFLQSKKIIRNLMAWRDNTNARFHVLAGADTLLIQAGEYTHEGLKDVLPSDYAQGRESGTVSKGYGAGPYGRGAYGSDWEGEGGDGVTTEVLNATVWHLGIRLGRLYAVATSDQRVLEWTPPDTTVLAAPVENAPTGVLCMCITQNMQIMTVGDGQNRNLIRWSDSADVTQWAPALDGTNNAGFTEYPLVGQPMKLVPYGQDVLLFTTSALYRLSYHGSSAGYGVVKIPGESHAPVGPNAIIETGVGLAWMGRGEIYAFNGAAVTAMSCDVHNWVFDDLNRLQGWKVSAAVIPTQNEVYWWFPSVDSSENDRYVAFDYEQGAWLKGERLQRAAWVNPGVYDRPLAVGTDNTLYVQEIGAQAGNRNMRSRALMVVPPIPGFEMITDELHHDMEGDGDGYPNAIMRLLVANAPGEKLAIRYEGELNADGQTKCLCNGKWIVLEYQITAWTKWRLGDSNLYARPGGKRGRRAPSGMRGDPAQPPTFGVPQVTADFTVTDITSTTATINFAVDRSCSWSTRVQGRSYSGNVVYEPVGRPRALPGRKIPIAINLIELIPETVYTPEVTLTNAVGGGTNIVTVPAFTTGLATGEPRITAMSWEDITTTSATFHFTTDQAGDYTVYMTPFSDGGRPSRIPSTGTAIAGANTIKVGSTQDTDPYDLPSGCEWRPEDDQLYIEGQSGASSRVQCPTLLTAGPVPQPTVSDLSWSSITSTSARLFGIVSGYAYPGKIRIVVQATTGDTKPVTVDQDTFGSAFAVLVDGLTAGSNVDYNGTVTIENRAGVTQAPVPTLNLG